MSSRLFHTIVGVGIALGAATSVGCANATPEDATATESALSEKQATNPDPGPDADAFCDATWPTTKGAFLRPPPACVDPTGACQDSEERFFPCAQSDDGQVCQSPEGDFFGQFYSVCFEGHWQCKPGKIPSNSCVCWEGSPGCPPDAQPTATK
jgi:hypothetical protein